MLNRRILRAKAMQAVYSYHLCKDANYEVAIERIKTSFLPDLSALEKQDTEKLNKDRDVAIGLFEQQFKDKDALKQINAEITPKMKQAVIDAVNFYHNQNQKDRENIGKGMVINAEKLMERSLSLLQLLIELADFAEKEAKERHKRQIIPAPIFEHEQKLFKNKTIEKVRNHNKFTREVLDRKIYWDIEHIRTWYKVLQKDEKYIAYQQLPAATAFQDAEFAIYLLRDFILKNDLIESYFSEIDYNWQEDKVTVRSMALKTLKSIHEQGNEGEIVQLSTNWDEDKDFFKQLFQLTLQHEEEIRPLIASKSENWDISRITAVDLALLLMALSEMIYFPSIPVKVTINEFLEIAKDYGTPKSKDFLNGLLDVLSQELEKEGKIMKTGRGLLDNK
jgi:N utilization substance protein B